jgi:uncharacterized protein YecE (DUF72 family)
MAADIRIGISGWTYPPWRKVFYPDGLPQREELAYASRAVRSIEINGTFYSLQRASSFQKWHDAVSDDFVFAIKGSRYVTHLRRLKGTEKALANFFASGVLALGRKLGPFLWQLPPNLRFDAELLERFFGSLPRTLEEMAEIARHHEGRMPERAVLKPRHEGPLRHALEVRHPSFETPDFIRLLRHHKIGLVVADTAGKWPFLEDVTADFVYVRLHGDEELYRSGYSERALDHWETKIRSWAAGKSPRDAKRLTAAPPQRKRGRDVFVYFDNDVKVHAPFDAISLAERLGYTSAVATQPAP